MRYYEKPYNFNNNCHNLFADNRIICNGRSELFLNKDTC